MQTSSKTDFHPLNLANGPQTISPDSVLASVCWRSLSQSAPLPAFTVTVTDSFLPFTGIEALFKVEPVIPPTHVWPVTLLYFLHYDSALSFIFYFLLFATFSTKFKFYEFGDLPTLLL